MNRLKRVVCIVLFCSVMTFPTAAFAAKDNHSDPHNNSYDQTIINKIFSFVSSSNNSKDDLKDFWNKNKDAKDWYENNKNNRPIDESIDIWKKWYCN
ncbi:hypothetical protein SAMN03159341_103240 [Paenibacillus sp. 1_12]|uniref:hypothetical protein n=1 Tax=Paenibacillus sp. 1_12 TaxID=1566278 RepID=UPI0008E44D72|nr:hypothetical protein [Paenibacillus sp. 1_12]SFL10713.1 hypothetical protein SAMN03159341_103240 [Paenibacillus sp. 1_12]